MNFNSYDVLPDALKITIPVTIHSTTAKLSNLMA